MFLHGTVNIDSRIALAVQARDALMKNIRSGAFQHGKRLPGERVLAKQLGISRGTVIEALDMLERQNYVERIPAKGTYIAEDINLGLKRCKIIFPFPAIEIKPELLGCEENCWIASEFYRGLLAEASEQNAEITFQHFEEHPDKTKLARQMRRIGDFEGGIFIGIQLPQLRESLLAANKPCVSLLPDCSSIISEIAKVCDDRENAFKQIVGHLSERGYQQLKILRCNGSHSSDYYSMHYESLKIAEISGIAQHFKIETEIIEAFEDLSDSTVEKILTRHIHELNKQRTAFFCIYTEIVPAVYKFAMRKQLSAGRDFGVFGYASGATFNNLLPEFTFGKINHFEMGREACRIVANGIRGSGWKNIVRKIPNVLIIKQST